MDWQRILKLGFILFLPVANPEFLLHIGKTALYDNTALTWEVFLAEISVKVVKVMCCFNFFFFQWRNYSKWKTKISQNCYK